MTSAEREYFNKLLDICKDLVNKNAELQHKVKLKDELISTYLTEMLNTSNIEYRNANNKQKKQSNRDGIIQT